MDKQKKFSLFLGDLSLFSQEKEIEELFSPFGVILDIRIKRDKQNSRPLNYGFIDFLSPKSAVDAMNSMDGVMLHGRPLK